MATERSPLLQEKEGKEGREKKVLENEKAHGKSRTVLILYSSLLLLSSVGNSIFFKKMSMSMPNYPYFLTQFSIFVYVPIFAVVVAYQVMFTSLITPKMWKYPKSIFAAMGALDSLSGVLSMFGAVFTAGTLQSLLATAIIPVTMIFSIIFLGKKMHLFEGLGATILIAGVSSVILLPQLLGHASVNSTNSNNNPLFNLIYLCSVIPSAGSAVYKERVFNSEDIDVNFLQAWVAVWQLTFGFLLIPTNTLSFLGDNAMPWNMLPHALMDGAMCLMGQNTITDDCVSNGVASGVVSSRSCDDCEGSWIPVTMYVFFNCLYNVAIIFVIKHGSAANLFVISTLQLPIIQIMFSLKTFNNPPDPLSLPTLLGLGLVILGLVVYHRPFHRPATFAEEDVVMPNVCRMGLFMEPIRRPVMSHVAPRTGAVIRGSYYSRIGIQSPTSREATPRMNASRSVKNSARKPRPQSPSIV